MVISVCNQKGGVSKTKSVVHIGASLAKLNYKVLLVDFDPQKDLSKHFKGIDYDYDVLDLLKNSKKKLQLHQPQKGLFVLPGNGELEEINLGDSKQLDKQLNKLKKHFDFVLIDCPPRMILKKTITLLELALTASDYSLIPIDVDSSTIADCNDFIKGIMYIKNKGNSKLKVLGIYFTIIDVRLKLFSIYYKQMQEKIPDLMLKRFIRSDAKIGQATALGKTIFQYAPHSRVANDYKNLTEEILEKIEKNK